MAIARVFDAHGWMQRQYDTVIERMQLGGRSAPGVLFHSAAPTPTGMRAVDVYESREATDRLAREQIDPLVSEYGLPMPEISEFDIHAMLQP